VAVSIAGHSDTSRMSTTQVYDLERLDVSDAAHNAGLRAREMRLAMEFERVFFRFLFGAKRKCGHFQGCGEER
jgi:hypothetical protein